MSRLTAPAAPAPRRARGGRGTGWRGTWGAFALSVALSLALAVSPPAAAGSAPQDAADAQALRQRHAQLAEALRANAYQRPLHIDSTQSGDRLRGEIHAVVAHPFGQVRDALSVPAHWCDILILPFNTKHCRAAGSAGAPQLLLRIGRKYDQPPDKAFKLAFDFRAQAASAGYFETRLEAQDGPLGTRDYRIVVAAVPLEGGRTFLRMDYAYGFGMAGRLAMRAYLATAGANKVGFTTVRDASGREVPTGGLRGVVERNAMRYYLAIDTYLASQAVPPAQQADWRINAWFDATEPYPRQLHEMDKATYVALKRGEIARLGQAIE